MPGVRLGSRLAHPVSMFLSVELTVIVNSKRRNRFCSASLEFTTSEIRLAGGADLLHKRRIVAGAVVVVRSGQRLDEWIEQAHRQVMPVWIVTEAHHSLGVPRPR